VRDRGKQRETARDREESGVRVDVDLFSGSESNGRAALMNSSNDALWA